MNQIIDLTDFYVTESDDGETYVVIKKDFNTLQEAAQFEGKIERAIMEQAEEGLFKACAVDGLPFAYLPLIQVKAEDYWEAYDCNGERIDEDNEIQIIEQLVAVCDMQLLANSYYRSPSDPGTLQIKLAFGPVMRLFEQADKEEVTITCVE